MSWRDVLARAAPDTSLLRDAKIAGKSVAADVYAGLPRLKSNEQKDEYPFVMSFKGVMRLRRTHRPLDRVICFRPPVLLRAATIVQSGFAAIHCATMRQGGIAMTKYRDPKQQDARKVLVIGGAGYVGSALMKRLLDRGFRVSVLDAMHFGDAPLARVKGHPNLTLICDDFRNIEALTRAMAETDSVIHLGGLVGDPACAVDPQLTMDVNITATKFVGEIAKACGVRRLIFASSCSVYGACDQVVDEDSRLNPQSLYAQSKVASEVVLCPLNSSDFAVTRLRFATIYGISGRTRFDLVINLLCAKAVREGVITVFGADQWRPFVHVDDVARALAMTLQAPVAQVAGEVFNVGSDAQNLTLGEAAELIKQQVPTAEIVSDDTTVDRRNYRVRFAKIRSKLGFEPMWTPQRGIAQVVALVRSNGVGHHSLPIYSNVLYLKTLGIQSFKRFKITGWEHEFMNLDHVTATRTADQPVAA